MIRLRSLVLVAIALVSLTAPVLAKDQWIEVRSKNFYLIGNASEKDIRKVATRLEQFRESFRLIFKGLNLVAPIPTNVVVFKSDSSYKPFKPKRADGKIDEFVAGFFQPGRDVNYITLSTEGEDADTFRTIFHEYVHFVIDTTFGKSDVPPWMNEGLAEYFGTFVIEGDQKVKLGLPHESHLYLLRQNQLMPLSQLFAVGNRQLLNTGNHSRSIFYAQSWALIHYLMQNEKAAGLSRYINARANDVPVEKAFADSFQMDQAAMEKELRNYVGKSSFRYSEVMLREKLAFESSMTVAPLSDATFNAYLGDLLSHTHREDDAEAYFLAALKTDPNSSMANTGLGMVKLDQHKYDEARDYLEKAIRADQKNHFALYRYAVLLSREGQDDLGIRRELSAETVAKIRDALAKAITANPAFTESYEYLAWVNVANNGSLDEAEKAIRKALEYQPHDQRYLLRLGEIYLRSGKLDEAAAIAEKIASTAGDSEIAQRAAGLSSDIQNRRQYESQKAEWERRQKSGTSGTGFRVGPGTVPAMTGEQIEKANAESVIRAINRDLRTPEAGETRVIGRIEKVDCRKRPVSYSVKTDTGTIVLSSVDFQGVDLFNYAPGGGDIELGCDANVGGFKALITYKPSTGKTESKGEVVSVEFVPDDFRLMTGAELAERPPRLVRSSDVDEKGIAVLPNSQGPPSKEDLQKMQRDAVLQGMRGALRQAGEGENREIGFLDKIECSSKGEFFVFRTAGSTVRLVNLLRGSLPIRVFTPDLAGSQFGCGMKPVEFPVVFVYKDSPDGKLKTQGSIVALDFVPKSFTLEE